MNVSSDLGLQLFEGWSAMADSANPLANLPFPADQLGWDRFEEVKTSQGLSHSDCVVVMRMVCGDPPAGFEA